MLGLFAIGLFGLMFTGTTVDICQSKNLDTKQCVKYVKDNSKADYANLND